MVDDGVNHRQRAVVNIGQADDHAVYDQIEADDDVLRPRYAEGFFRGPINDLPQFVPTQNAREVTLPQA